jgi:selenocysteine-specific elongation factor
MPIVGTAGHVDHGKSTLVKALTGRDPDRWQEEKERGLTIDLGFAWTELPSGTEVGFIDVPGHERFIKNMLAGVDAINVALLVVAADEGWMPQSEEHMSVLDLLEVSRVVVALTRIDLTDADTAELAAAEVAEQLAATIAETAPIIPVDSLSGQGVDRLVAALDQAIDNEDVVSIGRPRMWLDRAFSISGAGTIVTGTLLEGPLTTGDQVELYPTGRVARIRSLQSHERSLETIGPGNRTAVNLSGVDTGEVGRGMMLGAPGQWASSDRFLVTLRTVRRLEDPLRDRGAYHLHLGSGSWPVRLRLIGTNELDGSGHALLTVTSAVPVAVGDRFILREVGRRAVVAGGRVLDPAPSRRHHGQAIEALEGIYSATPNEQAEKLLAWRKRDLLSLLAAHTRGGAPTGSIKVGPSAVARTEEARLSQAAVDSVRVFQQANPLRAGMPKASLASQLRINLDLLNALISGSNQLGDLGAEVATTDFASQMGPSEEASWEAARAALTKAGLGVPRVRELGLNSELAHALARQGLLIRISPDLSYLPEQITRIVDGLADLPETFTVAQFRDHFQLTRKYAIPLLEWLDSEGHTVRDGNLRRVKSG